MGPGIRDEAPSIRASIYVQASPARVFETLTTADGWDGWFTSGTDIDARPDGWIRLRWKDFGLQHVDLEDGGRVLEMEQDRRFVFEWQPASRPTRVTFSLRPHGEGTILDLEETGYTTSAEDLAALMMCSVGWGEALTLMKFYLEYGIRVGPVPR